MDSSSSYDSRFVDGVRYFNACDFFEAHESWEELWADHQGPSRRFYQGLIQVAVCLHHFGNGNTRGAKKLFHSGSRYLADYAPSHEGVDVAKLLSELKTCCADILNDSEEIPKAEIVADLIPEIHLDPPPPAPADEKD